jgi:poly(hydroxyalkanoate) depolymerase family esterase
VGHEGWERLDCTSWDQLRKRQWRPGGRGLLTNHEFLEIKSMVSAWSNILTSGSSVRGVVAAVLLTISALAGADAAEPHEETGFGSNPGNLRMFSYVPADREPAAPLIIVLHGCKQKAVKFASDAGWLALADRDGLALLLPEQKGLPSFFQDIYFPPWLVALWGANNQNACFNWFQPEDTARDRGEALSIRQMIDAMIARHSVDRSRVYVVGLSAGGAMAAVMLAAYPERFAGGAIVAGVPYGCANSVGEALQCMKPGIDQAPAEWGRRVVEAAGAEGRIIPPISIWHGTADTRVVPQNRQELVEQWTAVHGIPATPARIERNGSIKHEFFTDGAGAVRVESVLIEGLTHAFPIRTGGGSACGQPGDFVVPAEVCAATEIARFWGMPGSK